MKIRWTICHKKNICISKKIRFLFSFFMIAFLFIMPVHAQDTSSSSSSPTVEEYYKQQMEDSGANNLPNSLPDDTRKILNQIGVDTADWESISNLTPQTIFSQITGMAGEKGTVPLKAGVSVLAIMLLCALLNGMKLSFGDKPLGGIIGMVGTLCICTVVIAPIVSCIGNAANVIKIAADFFTRLCACSHRNYDSGRAEYISRLVQSAYGWRRECHFPFSRQYSGAFDEHILGVFHCFRRIAEP